MSSRCRRGGRQRAPCERGSGEKANREKRRYKLAVWRTTLAWYDKAVARWTPRNHIIMMCMRHLIGV
jgi:hypothetical protein